MPQKTVATAELQCPFGAATSVLQVLPIHMVKCGNQIAANIMDHVPMVNIMPFGMCNTLSNPEVATATTAAQGVLTPMPCVPVTPAPWAPGSATVMLGNMPALNNCTWGGVIGIIMPGQTETSIP